jgi:Putative transposase DNA-binding domain
MINTRVNTALSRLIKLHAPREIAVERLDFHVPGLSRRLNRLLANCGRAAFRRKLQDLKDKFGIEAAEIKSAYTSQECSACGFVARENRKSQSDFRCGHAAHADVDAAKVITRRRSLGLDFRFATPRHRPADRAGSATAPPFREEMRPSFIPETKVNNCPAIFPKRTRDASPRKRPIPGDQVKKG